MATYLQAPDKGVQADAQVQAIYLAVGSCMLAIAVSQLA